MSNELSAFGRWAADSVKPIGVFDDSYHERLAAARAGWDACGRRVGRIVFAVISALVLLWAVTFIFLTKGVCVR